LENIVASTQKEKQENVKYGGPPVTDETETTIESEITTTTTSS
jgi:hypothetical protein